MSLPAGALQGHRILIVEDDYLIALILIEVLEGAGASVVGPIGSVDEAMAFLEHDKQLLDGAVLDINLHGVKSYPIAEALISRAVHFVFTTGYGAEVVEGKYARYPRCEKPFTTDEVMTALANRSLNGAGGDLH